MDVSGNPGVGNYTYMSIVIGIDDIVRQTLRRAKDNHDYIHMNQIKNKKIQKEILLKICFDQKNVLGLCLKIDRDQIIDEFSNSNRKKRKISRTDLICIFNQHLFKLVRNYFDNFLPQHKCALTEVCFECDSDCIGFAKDNSLKHIPKGDAHSIADIVAWGNNKKMEPRDTISLDLRNEIRESIRRHMKKL